MEVHDKQKHCRTDTGVLTVRKSDRHGNELTPYSVCNKNETGGGQDPKEVDSRGESDE